MSTPQNTAEGMSSGAAAVTSNTGGASGTGFDTVTTSGASTLTFSNTHGGAHGVMAYQMRLGSTAGECYASWFGGLVSAPTATIYARIYLYLTATPAVPISLMQWTRQTGSFGLTTTGCGAIRINTSGILFADDASGVQRNQGATPIPLNQWVRIEGKCTGDSTNGLIEAKLFSTPDSVTVTEAFTTPAMNTSGTIDRIRLGHSNVPQANYTYWMDDLGASDLGYLGPVLQSGLGTGTAYDATTTSSATAAPATAALGTGTAYGPVIFAQPARNNFSDNAVANALGGLILQTDLSLYCQNSPSGFPTPPFPLKIDQFSPNYEAVLVTAGSGILQDPWVIQRGYQSTPAVLHNPGALITHQIGAQDIIDMLARSLLTGTGSPASVVSALQGTLFLRIDGGASTTLYVKESGGSTNTGWVAK